MSHVTETLEVNAPRRVMGGTVHPDGTVEWDRS
jgi:hypothetical protein